MLDLFTDQKQKIIISRLIELRKNLAEKQGVELFKVWNNKIIDEIANKQPRSLEELAEIKGMGPKKLKDYGELILFTISDQSRPLDSASLRSGDTILPEPVEGNDPGLFEDLHAEPAKVLSVSDFINYVNQILSVAQDIKVQGEISKFNVHPTGVYMSLRDKNDDSVLSCYINPHTYRGLGLPLEEGMEVKVSGFPSIFRRRSELSFKVEHVELAGEGTLKKAYELLKRQLELEGLFARKRPLPEFISSIGIVTSKTGAVIDDFRKNLEQLGCKLYLIDTRVEGTQAVPGILRGISYFNTKMPELDCLVIMRGGGSLEDLQAFNNEQVVRAIFGSRIPTICAIGHDRDVPLACLVGDTYTSTPTAAAMEVNKTWMKLKLLLPQLESQLVYAFDSNLGQARAQLSLDSHKLSGQLDAILQSYDHAREILQKNVVALQVKVEHIKTQSQLLAKSLVQQFSQQLLKVRQSLEHSGTLLATVSPERNLKLGYSIVRDRSGKIVRSIKDISKGTKISSQLGDGSFNATVESIN